MGLTLAASSTLVWPAALAVAAAILAPSRSPLRAGALLLAIALLGVSRASLALPSMTSSELTPYRGQEVTLSGMIAELPRCSGASCLVLLQVDELRAPDGARPIHALVQVRTSPRSFLVANRLLTVHGEIRAPRAVAGFPRVELLARRGVHEVLDYPRLQVGPAVSPPPLGQLEALRATLERRLAGSVAGPQGALVAGLLLGREVSLPIEVRDQLRTTGTSHIVAVSGFNVAIVGALVLAVALQVLPRPRALVVSTIVVAGYTILVGAPPTAVRAALMFGAAALATIVGRLPDSLTCLVLAAGLMSLAEPTVVLDVGFQLSFAATCGLVLATSRLTPSWRFVPGVITTALGTTLAAQLLTLPLVLYTFKTLSLVAPLANVLIAPLLPALMALAGVVLVVGGLPLLGDLAAYVTWLLASGLLATIGWAATLPQASLGTGHLPFWALLVCYGLLFAPFVLDSLERQQRGPAALLWGRLGFLLAVLGLPLTLLLASFRPGPSGLLRAVAFDTAGDGLTLVETPAGQRLLLGSAGSPISAMALADQLPLFDRRVDLLVVTRAGERDLDGLAEIVRRYPVAQVVQPPAGHGESWDRWSALLAARGVSTRFGEPGLRLDLGEGVSIELFESSGSGASDLPSLSLRLSSAGLDLWVLGGELPREAEPGRLTVARLAPELGLSRALRVKLATGSGSALVVGGRPPLDGELDMPQLRLEPGSRLELIAEGDRINVSRAPCPGGQVQCSWGLEMNEPAVAGS
jgi:competence protein ComEC